MQLVLDAKNIKLTTKGQIFYIISEKGKRSISPNKLSSIAIIADVTFTTKAVHLAIRKRVPILFFDNIGKARARLWSPYFENIATLRRKQVDFLNHAEATNWIVELFHLKTAGQIENLNSLKRNRLRSMSNLNRGIKNIRQYSREFEKFRDQLPMLVRAQIMGTEGNIARTYWQTIGSAMPGKFAFEKRSRQPAQDNFNAVINYLYGMLYTVVESGIFAAGLDPYLGIFHADEYRKPTLSFDLIEPFRAWTDQLVINAIFQKQIDSTFFTKNQHGIFLNKKGKAFIIPLFNDFLRTKRVFLNSERTVKNHIYNLSALLAKRIRTVAA